MVLIAEYFRILCILHWIRKEYHSMPYHLSEFENDKLWKLAFSAAQNDLLKNVGLLNFSYHKSKIDCHGPSFKGNLLIEKICTFWAAVCWKWLFYGETLSANSDSVQRLEGMWVSSFKSNLRIEKMCTFEATMCMK